MKCKEFQIGDCIQDKNGFPMRIIKVGKDYACATSGDNECPWAFEDDGDQPCAIEITEDILRQNKWKVQDYTLLPSEHYYVKDEGGNHLLWNHGTLYMACLR